MAGVAAVGGEAQLDLRLPPDAVACAGQVGDGPVHPAPALLHGAVIPCRRQRDPEVDRPGGCGGVDRRDHAVDLAPRGRRSGRRDPARRRDGDVPDGLADRAGRNGRPEPGRDAVGFSDGLVRTEVGETRYRRRGRGRLRRSRRVHRNEGSKRRHQTQADLPDPQMHGVMSPAAPRSTNWLHHLKQVPEGYSVASWSVGEKR